MIINGNLALTFSLAFGLSSTANCLANESLKQQFVRRDGKVPNDGYMPKAGFVPDAETAISIGLAILVPIYGNDVIESQKPFKATLLGRTWVVTGSAPKLSVGGVAKIDISKRTGRILRVIHGK